MPAWQAASRTPVRSACRQNLCANGDAFNAALAMIFLLRQRVLRIKARSGRSLLRPRAGALVLDRALDLGSMYSI